MQQYKLVYSFQIGDYQDSSICSELVIFLVSKVKDITETLCNQQRSDNDVHRVMRNTSPNQTKVNLNLINLTPITYSSAQLHETVTSEWNTGETGDIYSLNVFYKNFCFWSNK